MILPTQQVFDIECDACLHGGGGFSETRFYDIRFPKHWAERYHIVQLEAINIIIAVKTLLPESSQGLCLRITTDNIASASVLSTGRTTDEVLAACSRELALIAITHQLELVVRHAPGDTLVLADALSRRFHNKEMNDRAVDIVYQKGLLRAPAIDLRSVFVDDL